MAEDKNRSGWLYPLLLAATFILSRLLLHVMGVRFDASGLDWYWQFLDIELLNNDLMRSVFYQHSQPPLFNLFLGIVLKLFPHAYTPVFALIFKGMSFLLYYQLFRILRLVGFKPWLSYLAATLFILMPGVVLYENWLFYTWPTAVALVFAAHRLLLFEQRRRTRDALLYIAIIAAVCLTRSMFHLIYLIPALIPVLWLTSPPRKKVGAAAGVAILVLSGLFLKNLLLFGFFGSSSWMGMNLWKIAPIGGKPGQLAGSAVAQVEPFSPIESYPESYRQVPASLARIPAVAAESKQNGRPNLNHFGYIAISEDYKEKALELIADDIPGYAGIVLKAWEIYFIPAHEYPLLPQSNLAALKRWMLLTRPADPRLLVPAGLLLTLLGTAACVIKRTAYHLKMDYPVFFLFCAGTVFYVAILGNLLEHGENMRFRVQTDPLLYLAALVAAGALLHRIPRRKPVLKENRELD